MVSIQDLDKYPRSLIGYYGGNAGKKYGIVIDGQDWMVKFPKSTKEFNKAGVSYTTSPISEFIGSKIYEFLDIPVHETMLGLREDKLVVACKDFRRPDARYIEFKEIKNAALDDIPSGNGSGTSGEGTNLDDVLNVIRTEPLLQSIPDAERRFWDMFVVDALIRNGDRNNTNWGVFIFNDGHAELAPVFDNGNSFFTTRNEEQNIKRLNDKDLLEQDAFGTYRSRFVDGDGHRIDAFRLMRESSIPILRDAVEHVIAKYNHQQIADCIDGIPESVPDRLNTTNYYSVLPSGSKALYKTLLQKHLEELYKITDKAKTNPPSEGQSIKPPAKQVAEIHSLNKDSAPIKVQGRSIGSKTQHKGR